MSSVTFERVVKQYPNGFQAVTDLNLKVNDGELLVVVGPSGCGKTTTLRMLAGLEDITEGTVSIDDTVVNAIEPRNRDIAMVFQSYALYPHLTVAGNLAYPLKLAGFNKADRNARVMAVAKQLQMVELLNSKPRQLSGGQRQRVAMGRAMVRKPKVFLMDEPLSNLDAKLRVVMRAEVAELQQDLGTTMFYVTHDQIEAMTMGDRVAVMDDGLLMQVAPPAELYRNPANLFVAGFIGSPPMNLINASLTANDDTIEFTSGQTTGTLNGTNPDLKFDSGDTNLVLGIRPEHITIGEPGQDGLPATIRLVEMLGSEQLVHLDVGSVQYHQGDTDTDAEETGATQRFLVKLHDPTYSAKMGDNVTLNLPAKYTHLFNATTGAAIGNTTAVDS